MSEITYRIDLDCHMAYRRDIFGHQCPVLNEHGEPDQLVLSSKESERRETLKRVLRAAAYKEPGQGK